MTTIARPTPLSLARPTAELPQPAAEALSRLESAFPAATAELHRVERAAAGLRAGESTVINGTTVTAVSLAVAEAVTRYEVASARTAQLSHLMDERTLTVAEFDVLEHAQDVMAGAKASLAEAGMLRLIGGA
ncbi:hypothetical protein [Streptomyces sp. NPDC001652]|uniref:hypothetical protein n=1 Tax=Streptomyces sp. NPDC001652 TaxID=3154393 RepID=UPI003330E4C5